MKTRRSEEDLVESGVTTKEHQAVLSEWLRSLTRNQMGSARTGSNPVDRDLFYIFKTILADIDSYSNHATDLQNKLGQLKTNLMDQGWL